jgi:hypothetical protein
MNSKLCVQVLVLNEEEKTQNRRGKKTPPSKIFFKNLLLQGKQLNKTREELRSIRTRTKFDFVYNQKVSMLPSFN